MCVTAILTETERKWQEGSVHRTEERRRKAGMIRVCGPILCNSLGREPTEVELNEVLQTMMRGVDKGIADALGT